MKHLPSTSSTGCAPQRAPKPHLNAITVGCLSLLAVSSGAWALSDRYACGGLSIGRTRATLPFEQITQERLLTGQTITSLSLDEKDTAYRLFGGHQFNPCLGLEADLFDLGKCSLQATTPPGRCTERRGEAKLRGVGLDLVGVGRGPG
jgi:OmpA-OmpF porin, OOP family